MGSAIKFLLILILIGLLIFLIYWLWQRQPKEVTPETQNSKTAQDQIINVDQVQEISVVPDGKILDGENATFEIKTQPDSYIVISTITFENIAKTNSSGEVKFETKLEQGLNLIRFTLFSKDFSKAFDKEITIYLKPPKKSVEGSQAVSGLVKNIFQDTVSLSSSSGEKEIKIKNAKIASPSPIATSKNSSPKPNEIRVGDYLLVLGEEKNNQVEAKTIEIFRESKPQIEKTITIVRLLSKVKDKIFSAKDEQKNKIIEFELAKYTKILKENKESREDVIQKDIKAFIIYTSDKDKNIPNLVYLVP